MKMSQMFPSKYLSAADLQNQRHVVVIDQIRQEEIGDDGLKPVVYFQGRNKGLVLNKTNGMMIASLYGDDTDNWSGRAVELYTAMVEFQGRSTPAVRLMGPPNAPPPPLNAPLPASPAPGQAPASSNREVQPAPPIGAPPSDFAMQSAHTPVGGQPLDDEIPF